MKKFLRQALSVTLLTGMTAFVSHAATLAQKNAFAYDIRVTASNPKSPVVTYKLNGLTAKVSIHAYVNGTEVATVSGTTNQTNSVSVPLPDYLTGNVTFSLDVQTKTTVTSPTIVKEGKTLTGITGVSNGYQFYKPLGVSVNNCPDKPSFGQILVAEAGSASATKYLSSTAASGRGPAIYAFDPQMQPIGNAQASNKYGFTGNITSAVDNFNRIKHSDDGRIFMYTYGGNAGVYEFTEPAIDAAHAEELNAAATRVLSYTKPSATSTNSGTGFDVWGSGSDLKVGLLKTTSTSAGVTSKVSMEIYNVGSGKGKWGSPAMSLAAGADSYIKNIQRPQYLNMVWDKDGKGISIIGMVSTPKATDNSLIHYDLTSGKPVKNYADGDQTTPQFLNTYAAAYNHDRTLLAVSNKNIINVFKVTVSNGGAPKFTLKYKFTPSGATTCDIAFDYANNIYVVNRSNEWFACWQLPVDNATVSVPAPASQAYDITATPINAQGNAQWNADGRDQSANLSWNAIPGVKGYNVYRNGDNKVYVTTNSATVDMPLYGLDAENSEAALRNTFDIKAVATVGGKDIEVNSIGSTVIRHLDWGDVSTSAAVTTDDRTGRNDVTVTWTPPHYGTVDIYKVYRQAKPAIVDGAEIYPEAELLAELGDDQLSFTMNNIGSGTFRYYVNAAMLNKAFVTTADGWTGVRYWANGTKTDYVGRTGWSQPAITTAENHTGHNSVRLAWHLPFSAGDPEYYQVYRDGSLVLDYADYRESVDALVPDGTHTYTVTAVFADGTRAESDPVTLGNPVGRDQSIGQYELAEVYNYPILTSAEAAALGLDASSAFITDTEGSAVANMTFANGADGFRGDIYPQAVFRNGKWYVSQIHDRADVAGTTADGVPFTDISAAFAGNKGGVVEISLDDKARGASAATTRVLETKASVNGILAADFTPGPNMNLVVRNAEGDLAAQMYSAATGILDIHSLGSEGWTARQIAGVRSAELYNAADGSGRVHFASASGLLSSADGGKIYLPTDKTGKLVVVDVVSGQMTGQSIFTAPADADATSGNYAFPIAGRDDFVWQLTTGAYYYVNAADGSTTRILTSSNAPAAGGMTFTFGKNNGTAVGSDVHQDVFFIHPSGLHADNTGQFVIDMPRRRATATIAEADFGSLVPVASTVQNTEKTIATGAYNAQWYGTEYSAEDDCVYIYLYVPGVRFAKYRFSRHEDYPSVEPELNIAVRHNADNTDITHFDATVAWNRPDFADNGEYSNIRLDRYHVELLDADLNKVAESDCPDEGYRAEGVASYSFSYDAADNGLNIDDRQYTAKVTPVFVTVEDDAHAVTGATATSSHAGGYEASIGDMKTYAYHDLSNGSYRVEFDIEPADRALFPEPVSFFTLDYSTDGGETYKAIPNLVLYKDGGKAYYSADDPYAAGHNLPVHDGRIPGTYRFTDDADIVVATTTDGTDKGVMEYGIPVVGYYMTANRPDASTIYRATAHYAASNSHIAKDAAVTAAIDNIGLTGVDETGMDAAAVDVYPVPAVSDINIRASFGIEKLSIVSVSGAEIRRIVADGDTALTIDIADLPEGSYLLIVNDAKTVRFVKK